MQQFTLYVGVGKISAIAASLTCCMPVADMRHAGVCHACETGLVAGTIGYRPDPVDCTGGRKCADLLLATRGRRRD
jgi:hypothetical protein